MQKHRFIVSGGGTGGHIFPAIAIADALKNRNRSTEILFVGAEGKMEMEKVPQAGYKIKGLKISGLKRSLTWKNVLFPFKLLVSLRQAQLIIKEFAPDVVIGVGGYASAPTVAMASIMGIPTLIQEQNSHAGLSNRWLAKKVNTICVAYEGMDKFFRRDKIVYTGNPLRADLFGSSSKKDALKYFGLESGKQTILVFGGSLGARSLNEAMHQNLIRIKDDDKVQFLWQIGSFYQAQYLQCETALLTNVKPVVFIDRMDLAYQCADLVICRAGALTVSEICGLGKASILVPSPNVTEDHQTANARAIVDQGAAEMILDDQAVQELIEISLEVIHDQNRLDELARNSLKLAKPNATDEIVREILKLINKEKRND
ncbi:MAG: undecaprenyldiphospho-muramoylpentapeptide beta-N-acetylglucosaminyltransferase [Saprospiraceae bacterium]|nr:undecaprenyldiphospho-muramoylpentapeptide beta-N-acetylglucosaminyltransferase [Saprospiraceae bacterium]